jgi:fused signal recognition particle receptor
VTPPEPHAAPPSKPGLFGRLSARLARTAQSLGRGVGDLFGGDRQLDAALLEELETTLLAADVGVDTTQALVADLGRRLSRGELTDAAAAFQLLRQDVLDIVRPCARPLEVGTTRPFVVMIVGVNGVGKTTTIAKLARRLQAEGRRVLLAAGDTFRAAAIEQLQAWGERLAIPVIAQASGADAAAVAHDAVAAATARAADVLIVDTAGRQHTHSTLMEELKKIHRVLGKQDARAPHEVLLVLDATTGQNALSQLHHFDAAVKVTGLALTKLDGTAKGGIVIAIAKKTGLPIRYLGIGEAMDDLVEFDAEAYVDAVLGTGRRP